MLGPATGGGLAWPGAGRSRCFRCAAHFGMLLRGRKSTSSSSPTQRELVVKCPNPLQPAAVPCRASIPLEKGRESRTKWPQAFGLTCTTPCCAPLRGRSIPVARAPSAGCPMAPSASPQSHWCQQYGFISTSTRALSQRLATCPHVTVCKKKSKKALLLYLHCTQVSTVQKICRCKYVLPSLTSPPFLIYVISIFLPCTVN